MAKNREGSNDRAALRVVGMGVAMGNSHAEVRACARRITGINDSDGIADTLRRFVLTA